MDEGELAFGESDDAASGCVFAEGFFGVLVGEFFEGGFGGMWGGGVGVFHDRVILLEGF